MFNRFIYKLLFFSALLVSIAGTSARAQVVASGMTGTVTDADGKPIAGAIVTAVHTPTNTTFTATTGANGRFGMRGMPVGGPYTVTANSGTLEIQPLESVETALGEDTDVLLVAKSDVVQLERLVATASRTDLDANATGASSVLSNRRISVQPTVARSFADLMKTNPFVSLRAGEQATALGVNSRYNSIMLDGAKINDSFGLNSSGLFSLRNPFSYDAIEAVNISLTPYDVRQSGSAGLTMNVISKRGTNEFHGSVYDIFTDSNWQGKDISGTIAGKRGVLKERTYGFTFGGPILKDRLFFFLNFEKFIRDSAPANAGFVPSPNFLAAVNARIDQLSGSPDMGTFGAASTSRLSDTKRLAKVDWNITDNHRLSVRYSDTVGGQPNFGSFNANSFSQPLTITGQPSSFSNRTTSLSSSFFTLDVKEHVWAAQLFNDWTSDLKSQFNYSYTKQDSVRATPVIFPEVRIFNQTPTDGNVGIPLSSAFRFGTETSSMGNELHIKTQTLGGSGDYRWRNFTFTVGGDAERSEYLNVFRQGSYGIFDYNNLTDFQADRPFAFERAVVQSGFPTADISKYQQTGAFAQVKWEPTARLNATLGMRVDYLGSPIAPPENVPFKNAFGITNTGTIDGTTAPAPRFGFNYSLDSKRMTQVRGGIGVFLGRNPWVWISNSYGNTGVGRFNVTRFVPSVTGTPPADFPNPNNYTGPTLAQYLNGTFAADSDPAYKFDPKSPIGATNKSGTASSINLIKPGMNLPMIQRGNIAIDRKLPFLDAVVSVEYIDTEQLSALFVDNMNLKPTTKGLDGRQRFAGSSSGANAINPAFANVIRTRSIHEGKSQYTAISIDRPMKNGWAYSAAYTRGHATEAQTLNSSTANSQWQFNPVFNQNQVEVARSDYEIRDRLQLMVSREFRFKRDLVTTVSLYYEGRSGMPYSMVYANDLNNDGFTGNDLIAVPTGATDSRFDFTGMTTAEQNAYFAFINKSGLSRFAGGYAPRNAMLTAWQNRLDLHVEQQLPSVKGVRLTLFADFLNFGSWASRKLFNYVYLLDTSATNGGQTRSLGAATYTADGKVKPTYRNGSTTITGLDGNGELMFVSTSSQIIPNNGESRWKIQAGASLKF